MNCCEVRKFKEVKDNVLACRISMSTYVALDVYFSASYFPRLSVPVTIACRIFAAQTHGCVQAWLGMALQLGRIALAVTAVQPTELLHAKVIA